MKKSVKGSIAAAAAGVLLLGGLSTVAFWTDSQTIDGGAVTAGTLSLDEPVCDEAWAYAGGGVVELIVPGDTITKDCTFVINATGDNLMADLTIPATTEVTGGEGTSLEVEITAAYSGAGTGTPRTITSANNLETVTATIQVAFPFGTDEEGDPLVNANNMQDVTATLNAIPITLTQTQL